MACRNNNNNFNINIYRYLFNFFFWSKKNTVLEKNNHIILTEYHFCQLSTKEYSDKIYHDHSFKTNNLKVSSSYSTLHSCLHFFLLLDRIIPINHIICPFQRRPISEFASTVHSRNSDLSMGWDFVCLFVRSLSLNPFQVKCNLEKLDSFQRASIC